MGERRRGGFDPERMWFFVLGLLAAGYVLVMVKPDLGSGVVTDCPQLVAMARASPTPSYDRVVHELEGGLRVVDHPDAVRMVPRWVRREIDNTYIVLLRGDSLDPGMVADELARTHGMVVIYVYRSLPGFAAYIPPCALPAVQSDPRVEWFPGKQ